MTQTNGETKLQKFHSVMQKVLKYGIVLALIAFIVLVLMNKDQFSEKVAKGTPEHKLTKIEVTDGDKVVQKFKAVSHTMAYERKTIDTWELQLNYGYGWEYTLTEYTRKEARERLKEYRENQPQYPARLVKKRVRKEAIA